MPSVTFSPAAIRDLYCCFSNRKNSDDGAVFHYNTILGVARKEFSSW